MKKFLMLLIILLSLLGCSNVSTQNKDDAINIAREMRVY